MRLKINQLMPYRKTIAVLKPMQNTVWAERKTVGAVAKLRETTMGFVMSVRLSAWNNFACTGWSL
jgi:hypothetical protein